MQGDDYRFALPEGGEIVARTGHITVALGADGSGLDGVGREIVRRIGRGSKREPAVAYIGRRRGLSPTLDVAENVFMGRELMQGRGVLQWGIDWPRTRSEAGSLLSELGSAVSPVASGGSLGELDRLIVELARALARDAGLVALDEPAAALDDLERRRLVESLRQVAARGVAVLVFSQRPLQALEYADTVVVVRDRALVSERSSEECGRDPDVLARVREEMIARPALVAALRERSNAGRPTQDHPPAPPVLKVEGWTVADTVDPTRHVVEDASFSVSSGEIVGLAGLRDSGAAALLLSVYGNSEGTRLAGAVQLGGVTADTSTVEKAIAAGLYLVATDPPRYRLRFIGGVSVPVSAASVPRLASLGLIDRDSDTEPGDGVAGRLLGAVRSMNRGGGADQLLGLVREFPRSDRRVLLLVDPTAGLAAERRREVHDAIRAVSAAGKSVVVASSDLPELAELADRVVTVAGGRVTGGLDSGRPLSVSELAALVAPL